MNRIKKARLAEGLTQGDLARKLSVSTVTVCKWENGKTFPHPKHLKQVAEVLHTSVVSLLEEETA